MESISPVIDKSAKTPIYQQIYEWIRLQILNDQLKGGEKLPSLRKLSVDLNISKNTITTAYEQLVAEGYVESIPKIGYRVINLHTLLYEPKERLQYKTKIEDTKVYTYNLIGKGIDPNVFQKDLWKKVTNTVLKEEFNELTNYGNPQGEIELREEIVKYIFESRGIICKPEEIMIGAGTQCCLSLLCQMLLKQQPKVSYESPGTKWLQFIFERYGFEVNELPILKEGYDIESIWKNQSDVIFVTPSHQFMKGKTIPARNRIALLNWAYQKEGFIIEDDYDSEMRYLTDTIPPLKSMDKNGNVVYIGSLSKIFMPSLRIAFMILPQSLLKRYHEEYYLYEQTASKLHQKAMARFMREGYFDSHIRRLKKQYRLKSEVVLKAMKEYLNGKAEIIFSKGSVSLLLAINSNLTEEELVERAKQAGVAMKTVAEVYERHLDYHQKGRPKVYIAFRVLPIEQVEEVIKLLSIVWFD
ncbi:MAG: PLP-dependent aminotransferase family protein [Lachnotalea sp.]